MKRSMDLILALLAAVPLLPLGLVIALAVRLTSPGPALYWSERVGRGGENFRMPKFRTMKVGTPALATHLMRDAQSVLTPIGGFLRRTSLDEIPQIWSVLAGHMSFVGPRPERPEFVQQFEQDIQGYRERFKVRPGLTGYAQVNGEYHTSPTTKLKYDLAYMYNRSIWLDLKILFLTPFRLLNTENAY